MNDIAQPKPHSNAINDSEISTSSIASTSDSQSIGSKALNGIQNNGLLESTSTEITNIATTTNNMTKAHSETTRMPLRHHVQFAVEQYFAELEGDMPTNLYDTILHEIEKPLLEVVLEQTKGNQSKSAKILGLNRGTLRKKMSQYGLM